MRSLFFVVITLLLFGQACGGPLDLPDQADSATIDEQARLAEILRTTTDVWIPGECDVRLLGQNGSTSYVWAFCTDGSAGASLPLRIDGELVTAPGDGTQYVEDVRRLFPEDLADAILTNSDDLRPEETRQVEGP